MSNQEETEDFYDMQFKQNKKHATHFKVSMSGNGKNHCYSYYKFSTPQKMNDGTMSEPRPQYLTVWGNYSCHLAVKDEDILPLLEPYNYETDGDYPPYRDLVV